MIINQVRLSFIQFESLADHLAPLSPPAIKYGFLLNEALYQKQILFLSGQMGLGDYASWFWFYYLKKKLASSAKPNEAWHGLLPFRTAEETLVATAGLDGTASASAYLYPWGIGLVLEIEAKGAWELNDAVDFVLGARRTGKYQRKTDATPRSLGNMMGALIEDVRKTVYGPDIPAGQTSEVFSIVTVVDAEQGDLAQPIPEKQALHRALDALTTWSPTWKANTLNDLSASLIETKRAPAAHALYGGKRGRVVWFPALFGSASASLGNYHMNLTMATLQVESLCQLAIHASGQFEAGTNLGACSVTYGDCVRLAAGALGRLYGGTDTYRTNSVHVQIGRSYLEPVNRIRAAVEMTPLAV